MTMIYISILCFLENVQVNQFHKYLKHQSQKINFIFSLCMLQVPSDQLRYIIGGVLAENDEPVDEEQKKSLIEDGFKIFQLPSVSYAVRTDFPYSSYLSIMIAVFRVYPKLSQYVKVGFPQKNYILLLIFFVRMDFSDQFHIEGKT